ncbi:hypothetical protein [uncultured Dokdonia sp.]|uniref:hypothetical protein n=1 Tax=uncultured Dokdonia sp. TaxID=575653 RepID=UPI00263674AE|nr:hypothetical protein [uncultured Dokdonia sp.]
MNTKTGFWITRILLVIMTVTLFVRCQKDDDITTNSVTPIEESNFSINSKRLNLEEYTTNKDLIKNVSRFMKSKKRNHQKK